MAGLVEKIREKAVRLNETNDVADEILALVGDARFALLGEASHGTHEFYKYRAIESLDKVSSWSDEDLPETFPAGL